MTATADCINAAARRRNGLSSVGIQVALRCQSFPSNNSGGMGDEMSGHGAEVVVDAVTAGDEDGDACCGRKAVGVDGEGKAKNLLRLRRIEGQVRGIQKMVEEERYCADVLTQISSVHEALRAVARELMRNHLKHCATAAIRSDESSAEAMYDELVDLMYKHTR